ncbi:hypothetical protein OESDEN_16495 [Oesophagostomum dentatum]|uniref:Uncharacterized protein n=1 Tax=Oesophagostomum dentatum TaxID=61180 RepID=A0A0B1SIT8_OESDE|nr:hypothetical protein OESDEN_16495 [Oesophagostomum dentatum]
MLANVSKSKTLPPSVHLYPACLMWSAWLIVIYTITCLLVIGIIAVGVWFVRVDIQRSKMISEKYVDTSKATDV